MLAPQIGCSTFGSWDFIRVPAPAARMTTAAGRLTVTWRCSLVGCCLAGGPSRGLGHDRARGAGGRSSLARLSQDTVRRPAEAGAGVQHDGRHITVRDHARRLSRSQRRVRREPAANILEQSNRETRFLVYRRKAHVVAFLVPLVLFQILPVSI